MKKELTCLRCEYQWIPRAKHAPKQCPKCKSYAYDTERVVREPKEVERDPNSTVGVPWGSPEPEERW